MRTFFFYFSALWALVATLAFAFRPETPAAIVSFDQMNVFYIGVDNPITLLTRGVPEEALKIETSEQLRLQKVQGAAYIVRASTPGIASITVSGGALRPVVFRYKVKRIPDPAILLGARYAPGTIPGGVFKAQPCLSVVLSDPDAEQVAGRCTITAFKIIQLRNDRFLAEADNTGARFSASARALIDGARPGDTFIFDEIKVDCPGDAAARKVEPLQFFLQ
ncbi:MAG: hypothetical protein JNK89_02565 [Saprospiraceae bacterium]|nr:hypothetical protein [Saprospiraceae bacterium]